MAGEIAKLYDSTKAELMEILHGQKIALTTDGWSSLATEAYVTVTAHFITTDWELRSVVLDTAELQASHTAANVAACIGTIIQNFDIRDTYDMICRAADQQAAVAAVIIERKLSKLELSSVEWTLMEKVKDVLRPFKVATEALSTDNFPTASAVLPLQYILLTQLQPSADDPAAVRDMKTLMSSDLQQRYDTDEDAFLILNTASFLDPRFHRLVHLDPESRDAVHQKVRRELSEVEEDTEGEREEREQPQQRQANALSAMGDLFGDVFRQQSAGVRLNEDLVEAEMVAYRSEPPPPSDSNPLSWWKDRGQKYPKLGLLARGYLAICGTSVRAERVFSTAGNIVSKKRSSLEPEHVNQLVFLANNLR
ncbi:E3 SUMO-protein ligase ZBED1-like [Engraulis encrasicolus]|uniref:E3 SUMO-protein ligase ZBED1-like n=1 Tax=Engraulis encrasicolus TaxID=184585 RepID=UPI002FD13264